MNQNNQRMLTVACVMVLVFVAAHLIAKHIETSQVPQVSTDVKKYGQPEISLIDVKSVLNIMAEEIRFRVKCTSQKIKKTILYFFETQKSIEYDLIATVQLGYEEDDIIHPRTKQMIKQNFPPLKILRVFLQLQKFTKFNEQIFSSWSTEQLNKQIGIQAHPLIKDALAEDPQVHKAILRLNNKMQKIFYENNRSGKLLPIRLQLDFQSIQNADFELKNKRV